MDYLAITAFFAILKAHGRGFAGRGHKPAFSFVFGKGGLPLVPVLAKSVEAVLHDETLKPKPIL